MSRGENGDSGRRFFSIADLMGCRPIKYDRDGRLTFIDKELEGRWRVPEYFLIYKRMANKGNTKYYAYDLREINGGEDIS